MALCGWNNCVQELSFRHSTDPDEGYCIKHGIRYVNVPLDVPLEYSKTAEKPSYTCIDCGGPVSGRDTKRCQKCMGKQTSIRQTGKKQYIGADGTGGGFGRQPIGPKREPAAVTARAART